MFDDRWEFVKIKIAKNPNFHKQLVCMSRNVDPTTEDIGKRILVNPVWLWNPGNRSWLLFLFCHVGECVWLVIWEKSHIALTIRVCWVCLQILAGITRYASNPSVGNHKRTGIHKICKFTQQYECLTWLSQWVVTLTEQLFLFSEKSDSWKCACVKLTRRERLQRKCTPFVWDQWTISTCIGWLRFDSWGAQTLINSCECRTRLFIPLLLACSILTPQNIGG